MARSTSRRGYQRLSIALVLATSLLAARGASAAEWFVAGGAAGNGSRPTPFGRIQDAIDVALPGDTVTIAAGTYHESLHRVRNGVEGRPVRVRAAGARGTVLITAPGRVLTVRHEHLVLEGVVLDGQYGRSDTVSVTSGGSYLTLRNVEVRRSTDDLIDMSEPQHVVIENSLIHHALNADGGRTDAHGIVAGAVRDFVIRNTEIHTFSGDGVQVDPGRAAPGWTDVTLEGDRIWLAPLPKAENGFPAGTVPGENAVDTKTNPRMPRARLVIRDTVARGFRGGLIPNMAAFNLKEHVDVVADRVTVSDSEIAFRVRGAPASAGAWVRIANAVIYDSDIAFRYEDDIERLQVWNVTIGRGVTTAFLAAKARAARLDVRNVLILGAKLPPEATDTSNRLARPSTFVNAATDDYRLADDAVAIDAGVAIPEVTVDRAGVARPQGRAYDVGAFEWVPAKTRVSHEWPAATRASRIRSHVRTSAWKSARRAPVRTSGASQFPPSNKTRFSRKS